jgi:hypothetical protein
MTQRQEEKQKIGQITVMRRPRNSKDQKKVSTQQKQKQENIY